MDATVTHRLDVALADYRMPDVEGAAVVRLVLQRWPEARVVLMSWFHGSHGIRRALAKIHLWPDLGTGNASQAMPFIQNQPPAGSGRLLLRPVS